MLYLTKRFYLHALHNLNNPDWTDKKNLEIFGKCYRLHGHDFKIDVTFYGRPDPQTGFVVHPDEIESIIKEHIILPYHGKNLNTLLANPSGEGLTIAFYDILKKYFGERLNSVGINETLKNYFRYPSTDSSLLV